MLKRKVLQRIEKWKEQGAIKCLMVRGARQVGKTYIVRFFGERAYDSFVEINFLQMPELKKVFSGNVDISTLLMNFSLYLPGARFIEGKTLLFLDEIQECPEAVTAIKFLVEDGRFDVIVSGSMLGIDYNRPNSYPVGSMEYIDMYALDFEEFLWAVGASEDVTDYLRMAFENRQQVPEGIHFQVMNYLRQYLVLGGMPEVVSEFLNHHSMLEADQKQRAILKDYRYDIAHYAEADIKLKAEKCYFSLPDQLTKENHKFQFSVVEKGSNARKYRTSLEWLESADLIRRSYNVKTIHFPLQTYRDTTNYRVYPTDIGLLVGMFSYEMKAAILEDRLEGSARGGLYEALVVDMMIKNGHDNLFFRKNEQATFEIEFLQETAEGVVPVEVKSGRSRSRSLDNMLEREDIAYGYKLTPGNVGIKDKKISLPLYMAMFL